MNKVIQSIRDFFARIFFSIISLFIPKKKLKEGQKKRNISESLIEDLRNRNHKRSLIAAQDSINLVDVISSPSSQPGKEPRFLTCYNIISMRTDSCIRKIKNIISNSKETDQLKSSFSSNISLSRENNNNNLKVCFTEPVISDSFFYESPVNADNSSSISDDSEFSSENEIETKIYKSINKDNIHMRANTAIPQISTEEISNAFFSDNVMNVNPALLGATSHIDLPHINSEFNNVDDLNKDLSENNNSNDIQTTLSNDQFVSNEQSVSGASNEEPGNTAKLQLIDLVVSDEESFGSEEANYDIEFGDDVIENSDIFRDSTNICTPNETTDEKSEDCNETSAESYYDHDEAEKLKSEAKTALSQENYEQAIEIYFSALKVTNPENRELTSIIYGNISYVYGFLNDWDKSLEHADQCIKLNSKYAKGYLRRYKANYQKDKIHDAAADLEKACELSEEIAKIYKVTLQTVKNESATRFESEKKEMLDKFKTFGNWALGKVGMSIDNFELVQDSNSGTYSVKYKGNNQSEQVSV